MQAALLDEIRSTGEVPTGSEPQITTLVAELPLRLRNLRSGFEDAASQIVQATTSHYSVPENIVREFSSSRKQREMIVDVLADRLGRRPTRDEIARAQAQAGPSLKRNIEAGAVAAATGMKKLADRLRFDSEKMTKNAHVDALQKVDLDGSMRSETFSSFSSFSWTTEVGDAPLVLGDVGVVAFDGEPDSWSAVMRLAEISAVALPVSSDLAVVRRRSTLAISTESVNTASVELSREFFVCAEATTSHRALHSRLGLRSGLLTGGEFRDIRQRLEDPAD